MKGQRYTLRCCWILQQEKQKLEEEEEEEEEEEGESGTLRA